jgi:hypothetical protein
MVCISITLSSHRGRLLRQRLSVQTFFVWQAAVAQAAETAAAAVLVV